MTGKELESCRVTGGAYGSDRSFGFNGCFDLRKIGLPLWVSCSDGAGWEHVSVSVPGESRCPTWEEMCRVKSLFWAEEECVVQYHPPRSQYVNNHNHCLHLWKPVAQAIPCPASILVGLKAEGGAA
jgi:hypothetical protein